MFIIRIEDTEDNTNVIGQFNFIERLDGSAYEYVRRCADFVARQYFLSPSAKTTTLAIDKYKAQTQETQLCQ